MSITVLETLLPHIKSSVFKKLPVPGCTRDNLIINYQDWIELQTGEYCLRHKAMSAIMRDLVKLGN